jgi:hypothetical protein
LTRRQRHLQSASTPAARRSSIGFDSGIAGGEEDRSCDLEAVPMPFEVEAPIGWGHSRQIASVDLL